MEKEAAGQVAGIDGYLFRLIATFEAAGMQQLGKIAHPITGDVEVDLDGARDSIEMLAAIQRKTDGNLNDDEKRLLEHVLYQLRMNFVDVKKEQEDAAASSEAAAGETESEAAAGETESEAAAGETESEAAAGEHAEGTVDASADGEGRDEPSDAGVDKEQSR